MDFYIFVLRKSEEYWLALCLENGIIGQGETKELAIEKLKDAILSFEEAYRTEKDVYSAPLSIKELHEFLQVENKDIYKEPYELRTVHA